jgi:hypothetical protein
MFRIDKNANEIEPLKGRSFSELGFKERTHLQEWIAKLPACLGEELLIIQKEFSGFSDTNERLDLLALDKEGHLVLIENKLDDTGKDVTWQALKYASYCASLSNDGIAKIYQEYLLKSGSSDIAEDRISEFLEVDEFSELSLNKGMSQRIILVAANFRKEVTSTVMWLLNFQMNIQCFKATPFSRGDDLFLNLEQIIPAQDTEDFVIGLADKARSEATNTKQEQHRHKIRRAFWTEVLKSMQTKSSLFDNISAGTAAWIGAGSGMRNVGFNFSAAKSYGRAEIYIDRGDAEENKRIFDQLREQQHDIETAFGGSLVWEPLETKRACRIKAETEGNIFDAELWPSMIEFMTDAMVRMERAFQEPITRINAELRAMPKN